MNREPLVFPKWTNGLQSFIAIGAGLTVVYAAIVVAYGFAPTATDVGYQPHQPVPYSHALHAGKLGMDCRYCHNTVEQAAHAAIPPSSTCMNCHSAIQPESIKWKLAPLLEAHEKGLPVPWVRVHDLPGYAYFNHSAHVRRGVGCVSCHGRVDRMTEVYQAKRLSMSWCLECHRNPEPNLRPLDKITDMEWKAEDQAALGAQLRAEYNINPPTDCSACHR